MDITDGIRDHVDAGLQKIKQHFDRVIDVNIVLTVEKRRHLAEINLHANGLQINAKETADDMYASIDSALQKIDRQVTKYKGRIQRHQPRTVKEAQEVEHQIIELEFNDDDASSDVEITSNYKVIQRTKAPLKSLSVQEAAFQLELLDDAFIVFSNADTQQVNVVYWRSNGTYGLIEPQF